MSDEQSRFTLPNDQPLLVLDSRVAFKTLTLKEKLYAHYLSRASWIGGLIVFVQTSPESPVILALLHKIFLAESIQDLKKSALASGVTEDDFTSFLVYAGGIYGNLGNYKCWVGTKIIPRCSKGEFEKIIRASKAYEEIKELWSDIKDDMYYLAVGVMSLGLGEKGITTYFSSNCTEEDAKIVTEYMQHKKMEAWNTRCFKTISQGQTVYEIRLASVELGEDPAITSPEETFKDAKFEVTRGDYNNLLKGVVENLQKAKDYASNDLEKQMLDKYVSHFQTGSLKDHKDATRLWIKDQNPIVESYIGFIENYRDPAGQRSEFEGFVAMVNKETSKKFATLVDNAEKLLAKLPWSKDFEKDVFLKPDFTSLEVLTFAGLTPRGINIPNYDEIRQSEGFKNVSLGNAITASFKSDVFPFLSDEDQVLLNKYGISSFQVLVALHELLGHGSGKLFEKKESSFNFDAEKVVNLLTGKKIDKWYSSGETYSSKFGALGSSYEECRADAVGLYLCLEKEVLKIFGHEGEEAEDIIYICWLSMFQNVLMADLNRYQPENKKWLQAHSQAFFVLLRVCLEAGEDFVKIEEIEPGKKLRLTLNREKIKTVGKKAIGDFLIKLQVYKSTGDVEAATKMYEKYSEVSNSGTHPWASWRDIAVKHSKPERIYIQPNTFVDDENNVTLKDYKSNFEDMIQSWVERFPSSAELDKVLEIYEKDKHHFISQTRPN